MKINYKILFLITVISFFFNLIWENAQMPWYANYPGFGEHFLICFFATIGDVIITVAIYFAVSIAVGNWHWLEKINERTITLTIIFGFLIAVIIEQRALRNDLWSYADSMPLLPYFEVGLLPLFQMMILPILTYYISSLIYKK